MKRKLIQRAVAGTLVIVTATTEYNGPLSAGAPDVSAVVGAIDIVFDAGGGPVRRLLTARAHNSDDILELVSSVNVDRNRHWIATTMRHAYGWTVVGFRLG